jgi:16S rRNA (guanine966-N2)-methyltransferase
MMKISQGSLRGRLIAVPKNIRAASSVVRESIFNVLIHRFNIDFFGCNVIDMFSGSGSLGIESISSGATKVLFVDKSTTAVKCISANLIDLSIQQQANVLQHDVSSIKSELVKNVFGVDDINIVFIDPPYDDKDSLHLSINNLNNLSNVTLNTLLVAKTDSENLQNCNVKVKHKIQHGKTHIYFCNLN